MTAADSIDPAALDRYLARESDADERAQVEAYLARHHDAATMIDAMPALVRGDAHMIDTDAAWRRLASEIARDAAPPRLRIRRLAQMAAALLIGVSGVITWRATRPRDGQFSAPLGRNASTTLPDGSRVTLAAGSDLSWRGDYGRDARDVALTGEAHFTVVHDAARPFRVHARQAVAQDIGTRFVVRSWPEQGNVVVAVEEGAVSLGYSAAAQRAGVTLRAGDRGELQRDGRVTVTPRADAVVAWTRGELVFDDQSLLDVAASLSRRFATTITVDSSLAARRLTARFSTQSLDEVLDAVAVSLGAQLIRSPRGVTITSSHQ